MELKETFYSTKEMLCCFDFIVPCNGISRISINKEDSYTRIEMEIADYASGRYSIASQTLKNPKEELERLISCLNEAVKKL